MGRMKILLQTTIVPTLDDWSISRFELLTNCLRDQGFDVTARDRDTADAPDGVLSTLQHSDFDEMWLFAVDTGTGLSVEECEAISAFRRSGRGLLVTRDHM